MAEDSDSGTPPGRDETADPGDGTPSDESAASSPDAASADEDSVDAGEDSVDAGGDSVDAGGDSVDAGGDSVDAGGDSVDAGGDSDDEAEQAASDAAAGPDSAGDAEQTSESGPTSGDSDAEPSTEEDSDAESSSDDDSDEESLLDDDVLFVDDDDASDTFGADAETPAEDGGTAVDAPAVSDGFEDAPGFDETADADVDEEWNDGIVGEGPPEDQEMPLAAHIEEMVRRLGVVFLIGGVALLITYPVAGDVVNFLWNAHIPGAETVAGRRPRIYGPLEFILTKLKVATLAGFVVGLPVFVYETYLFMRPGLYPRERRYYLAAVPTSLVLALIGVAFAHFIVLPAIFAYFTSYTTGTAIVAFGLKETFGLILILMGYMALVFQIPLFIMLAIMMNLVSRQWMEEKRLLFWGAFLGLAFLVSPDPTGMAPIIVGATMITLFEGTLALLRWTGN